MKNNYREISLQKIHAEKSPSAIPRWRMNNRRTQIEDLLVSITTLRSMIALKRRLIALVLYKTEPLELITSFSLLASQPPPPPTLYAA